MDSAVNTKPAYASIASRNQRESPLLRLPAELRNKIYTYVFRQGLHELAKRHAPGGTHLFTRRNASGRYSLALLRVCTQIYSEASLLPFKLTTFSFDSMMVANLLKQLPATQRKAIRDIELRTDLAHAWQGSLVRVEEQDVMDIRGMLPNLEMVIVRDAGGSPWPYLVPTAKREEFETTMREYWEGEPKIEVVIERVRH